MELFWIQNALRILSVFTKLKVKTYKQSYGECYLFRFV
jgi:hypothetical protein